MLYMDESKTKRKINNLDIYESGKLQLLALSYKLGYDRIIHKSNMIVNNKYYDGKNKIQTSETDTKFTDELLIRSVLANELMSTANSEEAALDTYHANSKRLEASIDYWDKKLLNLESTSEIC